MNRKRLIDQRNQLLAELEQMLNTAEGENRGFTDEERSRRDQIMAQAKTLNEQIGTIDEMNEMRASEHVSMSRLAVGAAPPEHRVMVPTELHASQEYRDAFAQFLVRGDDRELRVLGAVTGTEGGYLIPTVTYNEIWDLTKSLAPVVGRVKRMPSTDWAVNVPTMTSKGGFQYVKQNETTTPKDPATGQLPLVTQTAQWLIGVDKNMSSSTVSVEGWLRGLFAEGLAEFLEGEIINGAGGADALQGILNAGVLKKTTASATAITRKEIEALYWGMPEFYLGRAEWIMGGSTAQMIADVSNAVTGDTLWAPSLVDGYQWQLIGRPVNLSSGAPVWTANTKVMAFVNLLSYVLKDGGLEIELSDHFQFDKRQRTFRAVWSGDGKLMKDSHAQVLKVKAA